ncbi:hypothetical protein SOCEGT47_070310 [Sorangium cellulosum]|uniref:Uncharacterized protein n=1 Tax=Sorangium cellulosum TaxID=56 RepID=A0A4V0NEK2_SORCE|nr:DUF5985 family protein [Sorangium cellulosum]AUX26462.1 hypothetical protein SOCEGT47_070310 [Sorangium cellulosum]
MIGAMMFSYAVVALFFLRFWKQTRDRLFALFSAAFWLMMLGRIAVALNRVEDDAVHYLYMFRLCAYVLILYGIVDKNRGGGGPTMNMR